MLNNNNAVLYKSSVKLNGGIYYPVLTDTKVTFISEFSTTNRIFSIDEESLNLSGYAVGIEKYQEPETFEDRVCICSYEPTDERSMACTFGSLGG